MSTTGRSTATSSASAASSAPWTPLSTRSRRSTASATALKMSDAPADARDEGDDLALSWSGRWTLAHRILAVNILTLTLLALSLLYLDAFRNQLSKERVRQAQREAAITARMLDTVPAAQRAKALASAAQASGSRLRLYDAQGRLAADSWRLTGPTYELRDPSTQSWTKDAARALDRGFNAIVGAEPVEDFAEPRID